jgi:pimeloyl-ACP methyl ester carboxylesterase
VIGAAGIYVPGLKRGDMFLWNPEERVRNLFVDQAMADRILAMPIAPEQVDLNLKNQWTTARLAWEPRLFDPHLSKWMHRIKVPTQVIWGDSDQIFPAGYAAEMAKLIPGATSHVIAQCGHLPQVEKPQEFLKLFRSFSAAI